MRDRKISDAKWRESVRKAAVELGISTKAYRANRWPSAQWAYAVEVVRRRCKKSGVECKITPADLADLWKKQDGTCPLTGWAMATKKSGSGLCPETATVDRIDQSRGYLVNNIRLVSFAANNARYVWGDDALLKFCKAIVAHS